MACATFNPPPTTTTTLVRPLLLTLVPQQQLQQPKVILTTAAAAHPSDQHPLDLSNKNNSDLDAFIHGRTNSCSSTTSSTSSESYFDERRLKRKEQNKTAAHNYRQRKKSVSEQIEGEVTQLARRNAVLKVQQRRLEDQIARMRGLLNQAIEESKKKEAEAEMERQETRSEPPASPHPVPVVIMLPAAAPTAPAPPPAPPMIAVQLPKEPLPLAINPLDQPQPIRGRKYTWPLTITGKERKKEQNKLASRRFRQRRKLEQSNTEFEAQKLEERNRRLRDGCEQLEAKIKMIKNLMEEEKKNKTAVMSSEGQQTTS